MNSKGDEGARRRNEGGKREGKNEGGREGINEGGGNERGKRWKTRGRNGDTWEQFQPETAWKDWAIANCDPPTMFCLAFILSKPVTILRTFDHDACDWYTLISLGVVIGTLATYICTPNVTLLACWSHSIKTANRTFTLIQKEYSRQLRVEIAKVTRERPVRIHINVQPEAKNKINLWAIKKTKGIAERMSSIWLQIM